jgi:hypothetical protein
MMKAEGNMAAGKEKSEGSHHGGIRHISRPESRGITPDHTLDRENGHTRRSRDCPDVH